MISISAELAALGWGVEVYANPSLADTGLDGSGVLWLPHWAYELEGEIEGELGEQYDEIPLVGQRAQAPHKHQPPGQPPPRPMAPPQVFIAWRFSEALAVGRAAGLRFLWLHDEIRPETVPAAVLPLLDGAMVLAAFHPKP